MNAGTDANSLNITLDCLCIDTRVNLKKKNQMYTWSVSKYSRKFHLCCWIFSTVPAVASFTHSKRYIGYKVYIVFPWAFSVFYPLTVRSRNVPFSSVTNFIEQSQAELPYWSILCTNLMVSVLPGCRKYMHCHTETFSHSTQYSLNF